jgi:hypothetical protein
MKSISNIILNLDINAHLLMVVWERTTKKMENKNIFLLQVI